MAPRVTPGSVDEIDLSDMAFWARPDAEREGAFELLRKQDPVRFFEQHGDRGYYGLTRHSDIVEASRHPELFCSGEGITMRDMGEVLRDLHNSMVSMDDPRHADLRRIVSSAFTPRMLERVSASVETVATEIVDGIIDRGECDFVTEVAATLPLRVLMDFVGIPRSQERFILDCTNLIVGNLDPEYVPEQSPEAIIGAIRKGSDGLRDLVTELSARRQGAPQDDLISVLVNAEVEGERLSPAELSGFIILLVVAGNESTRNAIAHGLVALTENPDQRAKLMEDLDAMLPTAVEEIVRWASPVLHFRRTVTRDGVELGGQTFAQGDRVVLWYNSANRDDAVFADPYRFDVGRQPNDHLGFGGPGPHFCLGAHLARREIAVIFGELLRRTPDIQADSAPDRLRSNFINGIKHLPATFTPASPTPHHA